VIKRTLFRFGKILGIAVIAYLALGQSLVYFEKPSPRLDTEPNEYLMKRSECEKRVPMDEPKQEQLDVGPSLHQRGHPASWKNHNLFLGNTCFKASVGPSIYQDETDQIPDYYSINIEARHVGKLRGERPEEYWMVYFQRDFKIQELPERFLERKIEEIVSFNEKTKLVTFVVGKNKYVYQLPKP